MEFHICQQLLYYLCKAAEGGRKIQIFDIIIKFQDFVPNPYSKLQWEILEFHDFSGDIDLDLRAQAMFSIKIKF